MKMVICAATLAVLAAVSLAGDYTSGYFKSNGTYVPGYFHSTPSSTVQDNYTYKGNTNPYTGSTGSDYYRNSPSSGYFNGGSSSSGYSSGGYGNYRPRTR